jgi:hypothetical protein
MCPIETPYSLHVSGGTQFHGCLSGSACLRHVLVGAVGTTLLPGIRDLSVSAMGNGSNYGEEALSKEVWE